MTPLGVTSHFDAPSGNGRQDDCSNRGRKDFLVMPNKPEPLVHGLGLTLALEVPNPWSSEKLLTTANYWLNLVDDIKLA